MDKSNPACYECPKTKSGIHHWLLRDDHTSYCITCNLELTKEGKTMKRSLKQIWQSDDKFLIIWFAIIIILLSHGGLNVINHNPSTGWAEVTIAAIMLLIFGMAG